MCCGLLVLPLWSQRAPCPAQQPCAALTGPSSVRCPSGPKAARAARCCAVRGAYMVLERQRAQDMGWPSPIHDTAADTHANYDE